MMALLDRYPAEYVRYLIDDESLLPEEANELFKTGLVEELYPEEPPEEIEED